MCKTVVGVGGTCYGSNNGSTGAGTTKWNEIKMEDEGYKSLVLKRYDEFIQPAATWFNGDNCSDVDSGILKAPTSVG